MSSYYYNALILKQRLLVSEKQQIQLWQPPKY